MANATMMPATDPMVPILQSTSAMLIMGLCLLIACHCLLAVYVAYTHTFPPPTRTIRVEIAFPQNQPEEPTSSQEDVEELCYACAASKPDTMLLACGHLGLCTSCAQHLWRMDRRCPLCRSTLKGMVFLD
jgi:hypothetical protein